MTRAAIIDLDGTLCDARGRHPLLEGDKDWEKHSLACHADPPITGNIALVNHLSGIMDIILCSGRSEVAKEMTRVWLAEHGVAYSRLELRPVGNHDPNAVYKIKTVQRLESEGYEFVFGMEDYQKSADALNAYGIPTVLVASHGAEE